MIHSDIKKSLSFPSSFSNFLKQEPASPLLQNNLGGGIGGGGGGSRVLSEEELTKERLIQGAAAKTKAAKSEFVQNWFMFGILLSFNVQRFSDRFHSAILAE